jgi:hypothetical protein
MTAIRTFVSLSIATLAAACANPGAMNAPPASPGMGHSGSGMSMPAMEHRRNAMKDMHQKMANASTPAERQALMADHMKAMQDGMASMKDMHRGMQGMSGMTSMSDGTAMKAEMAKREQMRAEHMAMMQMMMDMMAQRMPAMPASQ